MNWTYRFSEIARKQFKYLPKDRQEQLTQAFERMRSDPLTGDVKPIKHGRFHGALRRRAGRYRIIFSLDHSQALIEIAAILLRSEKTYR